MALEIDLNADLGEGFGPWRIGDDEGLLDVLSSANVACGFHAGDPAIMRATVREALARGADIGAHVSFPDLQGFGRRMMQIETDEVAAMITYQLGALFAIARTNGHRVTHMSFHGALGNLAAADAALAGPLLRAVAAFDSGITVLSSSSRAIEGAAAEAGLRLVTTFLADRAYTADSLLVSRRLRGAVIHDPEAVLLRVRRMLREGTVVAHDGTVLEMRPRSILVHADTPGSLALARSIHQEIIDSGWRLVPLSKLTD